jgi:hypothetical protein
MNRTDMPTAREDKETKENSGQSGAGEYPPVPEEAIIKPEEERPVKMNLRPEENVEEREADTESSDAGSEDMDGDGSPDWDPAVGPRV